MKALKITMFMLVLVALICLMAASAEAETTNAITLHSYRCVAKYGCTGKTYNPKTDAYGRTTYVLKGQSINATLKGRYLWESCNHATYRARWTKAQFVLNGVTPKY